VNRKVIKGKRKPRLLAGDGRDQPDIGPRSFPFTSSLLDFVTFQSLDGPVDGSTNPGCHTLIDANEEQG
jgi:hypothetical protein